MDYSPILSLTTAALEIGAAVWVLRGPGRKPLLHTTAAILFFLAGYQVVEAVLCTGLLPAAGPFLPRLAFIVVAWLPPTGLLLVARLYPTRSHMLYRLSYGMYLFCLALVVAILLEKNFVSQSVCLVVFARYTTPTPLYGLYGLFYQAGLMSMLVLSAYGVTICDDRRQRLLLGQVLLGSMAFIFPALVTVAVIPIAEKALPSILCHFALFMAVFLVRLVLIERRWELEPGMDASLPVETLGTGTA
jgi:predicted neutral ceramidase superfamily lipid hydrolase